MAAPHAADGAGTEGGFTLVETVAALALLALVLTFAFGVYRTGWELFASWRSELALVGAQAELHRTLRRDLSGAATVIQADSTWSLVGAADTTTYRWSGGRIERDGREIVGSDVAVVEFRLGEDSLAFEYVAQLRSARTTASDSVVVRRRLGLGWPEP